MEYTDDADFLNEERKVEFFYHDMLLRENQASFQKIFRLLKILNVKKGRFCFVNKRKDLL